MTDEATIEALLAALAEVSAGNLKVKLPEVDASHGKLAALTAGIGGVIDAWREAEKKARRAKRELESKLATIEAQAAAIRELSTPVLEISEDILLVPVVGVVTQRFGRELVETLLPAITRAQASHVIVDITGVDTVDQDTASQLLKLVRAASLLGARSVVTGVRPAVAEVLANIGTDLGELLTLGSLREGLRYCLRERNAGRR
jgi:rsbT co-antagonist protein RsbR